MNLKLVAYFLRATRYSDLRTPNIAVQAGSSCRFSNIQMRKMNLKIEFQPTFIESK